MHAHITSSFCAPRAPRTQRRIRAIACAALASVTLGSTLIATVHESASASATASVLVGGGVSAPAGRAFPQAAPVGNLPGWRQTFVDDFTTNVARGQFPAAVSNKWAAYPSPWKDTTGYGTYDPGIVSINNGVLNAYVHTRDGSPRVAALLPKVPGSGSFGQKYGRYAVRFRTDRLAGYKMAWMLWPDSNNRPDGEIDFPEKNLDTSTIFAFMHHRGATSGSDQDYFKVAADTTAWHTTVIEWSPNLVVFTLDGVEIGRTTDRVPNVAMHWVLQTETAINTGTKPSASVAGNVQIDWVAAWAYAPTVAAAADTVPPAVALTGINGGATVSATANLGATATDASGVSATKWFVDGVEVGHDDGGSPWTQAWDSRTVPNGAHKMFAKARDGAGNWGSSPSIDFRVSN